MSNALAIAGVSAVLRDLLNNGLIDHEVASAVGTPVTVSVLPPDRVKIGEDEKAQLNLFLYQVTPNAGWNNVGLPSRDDEGNRLTNRPLALDLHYLLTAYGKKILMAKSCSATPCSSCTRRPSCRAPPSAPRLAPAPAASR